MPVEIGKVVEGTVTGITNFGAFIQLPEGKTGLCHISEVANDYVKDVKTYLKEDQVVKVMVLAIDEKGKISLSIRKADPTPPAESSRPAQMDRRSAGPGSSDRSFNRSPGTGSTGSSFNRSPGTGSSFNRSSGTGSTGRSFNKGSDRNAGRGGFKKEAPRGAASFEDKLSQFLKDSDEKQQQIKKKDSRKGNGFSSNR
ncbi:S1 RNA-binding domain-containing protein [Lutibacter sp. B2]|nr:S1 RNA-binding domain-containing protein [Lutibacter sp. B2]